MDWLLQQEVFVNPVDRWQGTPLSDAIRGGHLTVAKLLRDNAATQKER